MSASVHTRRSSRGPYVGTPPQRARCRAPGARLRAPYVGTPPQRARCRAPGARLRAPSNYGPQEAPPWGRSMAVVLQSSQLQYIPTTAPGATLGLGALAMVEAARLKPEHCATRSSAHGNDHYLHSYRRHPLGAMTGPSYLTGGEGPVGHPAAFTPHRALLPPHTTPIQLS